MSMFSTDRTDRERVAAAFRAVRKMKLVARMNFMCCGSCAGAALAAKHGEGAHGIFYSTQADDAFEGLSRGGYRTAKTDDLARTLYINWTLSPEELGRVCAAFVAEGLVVRVPENESRSIEIESSDIRAAAALKAARAAEASAFGAAL